MSSPSLTAPRPAAPPNQRGFQRFWRALRQLFHEVIGATFAVLGLAWLNLAFRAWTRDVVHWLIGVAVAVALLFLYFSVTSFRKAKKP